MGPRTEATTEVLAAGESHLRYAPVPRLIQIFAAADIHVLCGGGSWARTMAPEASG
jgi:hypothetical protein